MEKLNLTDEDFKSDDNTKQPFYQLKMKMFTNSLNIEDFIKNYTENIFYYYLNKFKEFYITIYIGQGLYGYFNYYLEDENAKKVFRHIETLKLSMGFVEHSLIKTLDDNYYIIFCYSEIRNLKEYLNECCADFLIWKTIPHH